MILINYFQNHFHSWSCSNHFDEIFSKIRRGFRKGFGAQHSLLLMIGKWKKKPSWWQQSFGTIFTNSSNAFECICHDLVVAKLRAYGLLLSALKMIEECPLGSSYCTWKNIIPGVSQGSILGHLLFNMFSCDLCDISYADDTTLYVASNITTEVLENLTNIMYRLFTWFANNQMKVNHWKCHLLLSTQEDANMQIANATVNSSSSHKLLGLVFDSKLKFKEHIENIYQKAIELMDSLNVVYV